MKNKLQLMLSFICLVVSVAVNHGQSAPGARNRPADSGGGGNFNIRGRVVMPDGSPAQHVKVSISSAEGTSSSITTSDDGTFQTGNISAGNYTLSVSVPGYGPESERLTVDAASGTNYNVALYVRMAGQKKGDTFSMNPLFKEVPKAALEKFKKGMERRNANDSKGAIPFFDAAIAEYPDFAAAYYERGSVYLKENDLDKALESFVKAVTIKPDYIEAKYGYGKAMFEKKNYEIAEAVFRDVLKTNPDMAEAHLHLGMSLFHLKSGAAAETELKAAIAAKGGDKLALAHLFLGQIYMMKKQNADAAAELQKYVELAPKAPNVEKIKSTIADLKKQG